MEWKIDLNKKQEKRINDELAFALVNALQDSDAVYGLVDAAIAKKRIRITEIIDELLTDKAITEALKKRMRSML